MCIRDSWPLNRVTPVSPGKGLSATGALNYLWRGSSMSGAAEPVNSVSFGISTVQLSTDQTNCSSIKLYTSRFII
jgi:hypothetical protein